MFITYNKDLLTDPLITNGIEVCQGCGCVCPSNCTDCKECSTFKDH